MNISINPQQKKILAWGITIIIILVAARYLVKTLGILGAAAKSGSVNPGTANAGNLSRDKEQYVIWADKLEVSIGALNTDENAVYRVFGSVSNTDDVKQLINAFGQRTFTYLSGKLSLPAYMAAGLSSRELEKVNEILAGKGIKITF